MINIYVQRTLAKACSDAPITSGSVGLTAQFLFSEEWNELTKKAIFETDNYKEPVDVPASGEVIVPESVLVYPWTQLRVGVRGESEDGYVVIPTVYADCGTIRLGANTTPVGTPPTPSQAEYLQAQIDELRESGVGGKAYVQDTEPAQMEVGEFWYNPDEETEGIPTTLPNPHKLTFSGAVNAEYDGSESVEVVIPQGGGGAVAGDPPLLVDITATEPFCSFIVTEDDSGNPLNCENRFYFEAILIPAVTDPKLFLVTSNGNTQSNGLISPLDMNNWTNATLCVTGTVEKVMSGRYNTALTVSGYNPVMWPQIGTNGNNQYGRHSVSTLADHPKGNAIKSLMIGCYTDGGIAAGSTLKIWGD